MKFVTFIDLGANSPVTSKCTRKNYTKSINHQTIKPHKQPILGVPFFVSGANISHFLAEQLFLNAEYKGHMIVDGINSENARAKIDIPL
jgi:hypothetical protein